MFSSPKFRKFRKAHKNATGFRSHQSYLLHFGSYGLKSLESGWLTSSQLESVRRVIIRKLRKIGLTWICVFPFHPVGRKPAKTRMGKGKGNVLFWVCPVGPGRILFEIQGSFPKSLAKDVLTSASLKLPLLTKFVSYDSSFNPL
jgi:large subunit ribosomal protein L16